MKRSLAILFVAIAAGPAAAQQDSLLRPLPPSTGVPLLDEARRAQRMFEEFRRDNLPDFNGSGEGSTKDQQRVGRFIYWYNENEPPPPPEPVVIKTQRKLLLDMLDTVAAKYPQDDWTAGQRIRYLSEDGRPDAAVSAALACKAESWWCAALLGFAYHDARQYVRADSAFQSSLRQMSQRLRCDWTDVSVLLDPYTVRTYHRTQCGSAERLAFESRLWWLAKPLYASPGLDTRTEYFARMTMTKMLEDAPSAHEFGFDIDERELLLRYGWPRAWSNRGSRGQPRRQTIGAGVGMGGMGARGGPPPRNDDVSVVGHEPAPSYQFLPPAIVSISPATTDSVDWETGFPPVHARYAPAYARHLYGLTHQSAMFRRGDTALVVLAWDATDTPLAKAGARNMALVLTHADTLKPVITRRADAPLRGMMIGRGPWGPLLMSAELTADKMDSAVRARYGLRPPFGLGARVRLSEMLFFAEYNGLPATVEEAAAHALPAIKMRNDQKLGIYFESYGTNPAGEKLKVTLTVAREEDEPGFVRRRLQSMRISAKATPVRLTIEDQSTIGQRMTPRSAYLDVKTLKKGAYIVQLEVEVAGQYVVRTERALEITN